MIDNMTIVDRRRSLPTIRSFIETTLSPEEFKKQYFCEYRVDENFEALCKKVADYFNECDAADSITESAMLSASLITWSEDNGFSNKDLKQAKSIVSGTNYERR